MRRIIHNTTAIAACLSLLVPSLAQAQIAPPEGEQPPVPPAQEQSAAPQSDAAAPEQPAAAPEAPADAAAPEAASPEPAAEAPAVEAPAAEAPADPQPAPEPAAEVPASDAPDEPATAPEATPEAAAPEPAAEAPAAEVPADPQPVPGPEAAAEPVPADAAAPGAPATSERPQPAAREQQRERPAQAEGRAAQPVQAEPPAPAEAARQQDQERPAPAAREQQAERPATAPAQAAPGEDPLRDALEAEQEGAAENRPALATAAEPAQDEAAAGQAPATPDEDALRDALTREQAGTPAAADQAPAAEPPAQASSPAPEAAPEAGAPVTEAARQSAQETRAAPAAALDEDSKGEVVEQQITEENSRSSDEDFATSLREALQPQGEQQADQQAAGNDDGNDDNDLAKALLLGLGAVAVGTYLNNNRQVALSAPDRVVVTRPDGSQELIKDDTALLRQPGSTVATENFDDGSSRTVVTRADGSRVVTIRDADLRVLRRTLVSADGTQTRLIDDTAEVAPVDVATLPAPAPAAAPGSYRDEAALREALRREVDIDRRFTLGQIRTIPEVRALVPPVTIDAITFDTGSAAISPDQARQLSTLGNVIQDAIAENPREVFLIEGHTDLVGSDAANLALSDRRAESVALALTEYFQVPPENLVVQGYGEQFPQVRQEGDVRENRRAAVRRITDLLQTAEAR